MTAEFNDDRLRRLYATLLARRASSGAAPEMAVEEIHALAAGTYEGEDRAEKLEAVLSDPRTAAEFQFFLDIAQHQPRSAAHMQRWLAAAASVTILISATLVWRALQPAAPGPARSTDADFLVAPSAGASVSRAAAFVWHRVAESESYHFELIDEQGNLVHEAITRDTTQNVPATANLGSSATFRWWVTARLRAGTDNTTPPRAVTFRR